MQPETFCSHYTFKLSKPLICVNYTTMVLILSLYKANSKYNKETLWFVS